MKMTNQSINLRKISLKNKLFSIIHNDKFQAEFASQQSLNVDDF